MKLALVGIVLTLVGVVIMPEHPMFSVGFIACGFFAVGAALLNN